MREPKRLQIRAYQPYDYSQVRQIFADGIAEHSKTAMWDSWNGAKPIPLLTHLAILTFGLGVAFFWSSTFGLSIVATYTAFHVWLFNYIFEVYVQFHLNTDMKDGEMTFWTTRPNFMLVIVDQDSSKILGLVSMQKKSEDTAELNRLSVRSDTRGQGIGRKLVEGFIEEARKRGFKKVYLETADAQKPAIRLYERVGFKNIGTDGISHVIGPYIPSCFHGVYVVKLTMNV